jgi:hypothetical protein
MKRESRLPLVSVIVPTYNRCALLKHTIESVLAQTYPAIEIIVVDDGSTDETSEMLKHYGKRIVSIRKANGGGTAARNTGLKAARGQFLNFLDHDDLFMPTKVERQMQMMRARPDVGLVHCGYYRIDKDGNDIDIVNFLPEGDVRERIVCGCFVWSGGPLIRRECMDRVGTFDEAAWSSDADLWLRIAIAGYRFGCVQEPLGAYRILPDSSMADVARTERMDMPTLARVFSDPRLPAGARAKMPQAYFNQRFWLSCRYYTVGQWADAERNLREAIRRRPEVLDHPWELLGLFCTNALDPRVDQPIQFINDVFDHLPPAVETLLRPHYAYVLSWIHAGLSMRSYGHGRLVEARGHIAEAIRVNRAIVEKTDEFARALSDYALRLPVIPERYVDTVLQNLPVEGKPLVSIRSRVLSDVNIASAFRDYSAGKWNAVPRKVLTALRHDPVRLSTVFVKFFPRLIGVSLAQLSGRKQPS